MPLPAAVDRLAADRLSAVDAAAAGAYAAEHFPAWSELAGKCVDWRAGGEVAFDTVDGLAAVALVRAVVASAG